MLIFTLLMAVNNVGTAGGIPNIFECMTRKQVWTMLMVNVCAATSMTHHFLPKMKSKKRGLIVNISSITCLSPTPYGMLYGASKVIKNIHTTCNIFVIFYKNDQTIHP
jgi:short-subunit dehydrogenase